MLVNELYKDGAHRPIWVNVLLWFGFTSVYAIRVSLHPVSRCCIIGWGQSKTWRSLEKMRSFVDWEACMLGAP